MDFNQLIDNSGSFSKEISREFFRTVYSYMFAALGISGIIAYMVGTPEFFLTYFLDANGAISPLNFGFNALKSS